MQIPESSDSSNGAIRPGEEQFMKLHAVTACARILCRQFQSGEIYSCLGALLYHFRTEIGRNERRKNSLRGNLNTYSAYFYCDLYDISLFRSSLYNNSLSPW